MTRPTRLLAAALLLGLAGSAGAQTKSGDAAHAGMRHGAALGASKAYMDAMAQMDAAMAGMGMTGHAGRDFAAMMIPHHQAAIDMAKAYLAGGEGDPELTKMSREIVAAQEREIAILKAWLARDPR